MKQPLRIGIAGLGTVGRGVVKILQENAAILAARGGRDIVVTAVSARNRQNDRGVDISAYRWHDNSLELASAEDVDLVVELIGGSDGIAKELCQQTLAAGKHFVTANKAMIAHHGTALARLGEKQAVGLKFEAAVAGGIPVIKAFREGLAADRITRVAGILNGTCNYILTEMEATGADFESVLQDAQQLGYAEADPTFDIDGIDSAHKLAILSSIAFGTRVDFDKVEVEGIRHVTTVDIKYARDFGYRIKLLGTATYSGNDLEQRVMPCLVPLDSAIANVTDAFNAVVAEGKYSDRTMLEGRGAGEGPTASAVVADIVDIARGNITPVFSVPAVAMVKPRAVLAGEYSGAFYIRAHVHDRPGVMADITETLSAASISIESLIQRGQAPNGGIYVVLTTHKVKEAVLRKVMKQLAKLDCMVNTPITMRIENS